MITRYEKFLETFLNTNTLNYFDFDGTLVKQIPWYILCFDENNNYIPNNPFSDYLKKVMEEIGDFDFNRLQILNNRLVIKDWEGTNIETKKSYSASRNRIIKQPSFTNKIKETISQEYNKKIYEIYNKSLSRIIVTARAPIVKEDIKKTLDNIGVPQPEYGIHCFPFNYHKDIDLWKANILYDVFKKEGNFTSINLYEDNRKWLKNISSFLSSKDINVNAFHYKKDLNIIVEE